MYRGKKNAHKTIPVPFRIDHSMRGQMRLCFGFALLLRFFSALSLLAAGFRILRERHQDAFGNGAPGVGLRRKPKRQCAELRFIRLVL